MGKAIWDYPVGFSASHEEGRRAFHAGKPQGSHPYGESLGAKEWERGWKSAHDHAARTKKEQKPG